MFTIPYIEYSLNATGITCSQMQYLCVAFDKGENPQLDKPQLPFDVSFVRGEDDARYVARTPEPGCTKFITCKGSIYYYNTLHTLCACYVKFRMCSILLHLHSNHIAKYRLEYHTMNI